MWKYVIEKANELGLKVLRLIVIRMQKDIT